MISYQSVEIKDEKALFIDDYYYKKFAKKVDFGMLAFSLWVFSTRSLL